MNKEKIIKMIDDLIDDNIFCSLDCCYYSFERGLIEIKKELIKK